MSFDTKSKMSDYIQECKIRFVNDYGSLISEFEEKNVELVFNIKKVSHIKGIITLVAEIELIPKNDFKCGEIYWKKFSVKLLTLKKAKKSECSILRVHRKSVLFHSFLKKELRLLDHIAPHVACRENLLNYIARVVNFSRFSKFPIEFRGKDLSTFFLIIECVFIAILIATASSWYGRWYR